MALKVNKIIPDRCKETQLGDILKVLFMQLPQKRVLLLAVIAQSCSYRV